MTAEEIRNNKTEAVIRRTADDCDTSVQFEQMLWLKEIAYQLAVMNERQREEYCEGLSVTVRQP